LALLAGCVSTTDVLQLGPDTYTVSSTADGMRMAVDARQRALQAAAEKCTGIGRTVEVTQESTMPTRMGIDTTISVVFRCV
ncbi:MAG: hypothetical protein AAGC69_20180, partial [Paracraurococcus sp.]